MLTRFVTALAVVLGLTACNTPDTPQEVSRAYWQAMIDDDRESVVRLSTLVSDAAYDGYEQDWQGVTFTLGRTVIDERTSEVEVTLTGLPAPHRSERTLTTHLVLDEEAWRVDYFATRDAFNDRPMVDQVIGTLSGLGERLTSELSRHSAEAAREMERLARELEHKAKDIHRSLEPELERYADQLQQAIRRLADSIRDALEETPSASPEDKRTLNQTVYYLEQQHEALDQQPDLITVADSSRALAETQAVLNDLEGDFSGFRREWERMFEEIRRTLRPMLESAE